MNTLMIFFEAIILFLLAVNILYCYQLNKKIKNIQTLSGNIKEIFGAFDAALVKLDGDLVRILDLVYSKSNAMESLVKEALDVISELNMFIGSGEILIDKLEKDISLLKKDNSHEMHNLNLGINNVKNYERSADNKILEMRTSYVYNKSI